MKHIYVLLMIFLFLNGSSRAQSSEILNTVNDLLSVTDFVLQANDLVANVNILNEKMKFVNSEMDRLNISMAKAKANKSFSVDNNYELNQKIQIYTMQVRIYGKAIHYLLQQLYKAMQRYEQAAATKASLSLQESIADIKAEIMDAKAVATGETNFQPVTKKIAFLGSKEELRMTLEGATRFVEGANGKILEINKNIDTVLMDIISTNTVINEAMEFGLFYSINYAADKIGKAKPKGKEK